MSSSLRNPSVTPVIMLATSERTSPCIERARRESSWRSTRIWSPSWRTVTCSGTSRCSSPLGPFTVTVAPSMRTSTPPGTAMGAFPIRDISFPSPDVAEDLTTDALATCLAVGHETPARGEHGDAEPTEDALDLVVLAVHPQARLGHPTQAGDDPAPVGRVLHVDLQQLAGALGVVGHRVADDVALLLEELGQGLLLLREGHDHLVVHRGVRVADPGEHVGDRVVHRHRRSPSVTSSPS